MAETPKQPRIIVDEFKDVPQHIIDEVDGIKFVDGRKNDSGKPDWTLMPWSALTEVQRVMDYGAKKYDKNNWMYVKRPRPRYLAAMFRHVVAYAKGEQLDPESGLHHLAHAVCCALFIIHFELNNE